MTADEHVPDEMPEEWLTSSGVTDLAGITYRQLDHWVGREFLRPEVRWGDASGKGHGRIWPPEEAETARRMARLVAAGFPPAVAASFARDQWPAGEIAPGIEVRVSE